MGGGEEVVCMSSKCGLGLGISTRGNHSAVGSSCFSDWGMVRGLG